MDRYEFLCMITDMLSTSKTTKEIDMRVEILINDIKKQGELIKGYLKAGI